MELDKVWNWQKKKLACRIRTETGNPAGDSLREMFTELAGVDLNDLLGEMKTTRKKKEATNKVLFDHEGDKTFKEVLFRSRVLGASKLAIDKMQTETETKAASVREKNIRKTFAVLPPSPPKRVLIEIQRERSKPLRLPDQEEQKVATVKLERKLAKQRAARMAAIEKSAKEEEERKMVNSGQASRSAKDAMMGTVLPGYQGDQFGTAGSYLDGMLYLSRMADAAFKTSKIRRLSKSDESVKVEKSATTPNEPRELKGEKDPKKQQESDNANRSSENAVSQDINAKLNCAISLCSWSRNPANATRLASEGAVRALMQLSMEGVNKITFYCAAAFRYMSEQNELAISMIDEGTISTISDLVSSTTDEFVATNLTIALVNLTRVNGKEGQVVEAAIVLALMNLIMIKPELGAACARGLYNLTCVDVSYPFIERVIRALVTLSLSGSANVKHLCAAALCNLSDLKAVRPRMVEEGAINVLTTLSRGAETRTRRVCAVILQNLSAAKSVRVEMASRNSVTAAYGLSSDQDPIILRCIGLTLSRLAMEPTNCQRIIHENGITALCNIAVKYPTIPGISQPVASAFQLLSSNQAFRVNIVSEGSVTAIASFLRSSVDMFTLQHSLLALCNLLCEPENHLPIIQQGLITTLIAMCNQDNDLLKDFCSLAFLNLSCAEDSRKHIVNAGAIVAIISIAKQDSELTKRRCAATLCNVSYYNAGMSRMVADGMIPCIVSLVLSKDILTVHYSCAALCRLCSTVENSNLILESGAVSKLVQGSIEGDYTSKQFCGAVLSALSFYESCRVVLCEMGAISALKGLAEFNDDVTKQRCLVAFANISCEVSVQNKMVSEGVVGIIAELANSYQEINYICCAKAICNLACSLSTKLAVAKEGGVHALLMISMVQSVDRLTKLLCVLGLNNLLDETTMEFMLDEGLISSIANLSKIGDSHISNLCAKIFNHLTKNIDARLKIVEKAVAVNAMFRLADSKTLETKIIATRTCCNLVLCSQVRSATVRAGVFGTLEKGLDIYNSKDTVSHCLVSAFSTCAENQFMEQMAMTTLPAALLEFATSASTSASDYSLAVKTLSMVTHCRSARTFLQNEDFFSRVLTLIENNLLLQNAHYLAAVMRYIVVGYSDVSSLLQMGVLPALCRLSDASTLEGARSAEILRRLVQTLRILCLSPAVIPDVATDGTLSILKRAIDVCGSSRAEETMYDVAVLMYLFASHSVGSRLTSSTDTAVAILVALVTKSTKNYDLLCATIGSYLMDPKSRDTFNQESVAKVLATIAATASPQDERMLFNSSLAIYAFSKIAGARETLVSPHVAMDKLMSQPMFMDNARVKANSGRALKNLMSDMNEAIEEGIVASLIAVSLEGKLRSQASDEFQAPAISDPDEKSLELPECAAELAGDRDFRDRMWHEQVLVTKGGAAGKGPEPPEPPAMHVDGSSEYPHMMEELEAGEAEGKTKMAFAKMQVPQTLKESCTLSDSDFVVKKKKKKTTTGAGAAGGGADGCDDSAMGDETTQQSNASSTGKFEGEDGEDDDDEEGFEITGGAGPIDGKGVTLTSGGGAAGEEDAGSQEDGAGAGMEGFLPSSTSGAQQRGSGGGDAPESISPNSSIRSIGKKKGSSKKAKDQQSAVNMGEQAARLGLYA